MHHRTFLHDGFDATRWAAHRVLDQLFDGQLDVGSESLVVEDHHVFEANEGLEYLAMVAKNEGASWLLGHTSSLKHLRRAQADPGQGRDPRQNPINRISLTLGLDVSFHAHNVNRPGNCAGSDVPWV
jgi:hypothetical protein